MAESTPKLRIRPGQPSDIPFILSMIKELAAYEREPDAVHSNELSLHQYFFGKGFGRGPCAEALVAEVDGTPQGVAIYFMNFSTWSGAVGLYLEDLYVRPDARRLGLGKAMLIELASIARARGCRRMEWAVLDWNTSAQEFYRNLGAREMSGWHVWRMDESSIQRLADTTR
ncbi:MAG: GNAT family N-acetyltransferase [Planctomycetes bacterium]|nr:GNAT family N-acetyltransferase [Planctomycetota bacterium]